MEKIKSQKVYIVGAGPGDPELLTIKGKRLLEEAEVVIYDKLVGEGVLDFVNPGAELIYVGKEPDYHLIPQEEINGLIVTKAKSGKAVVRLKGGDPYIFGRGSEEVEALFNAGISFEVVPGIAAASGVSSYAGIPLTDRRYSSGVTFVTGHKRAGNDMEDVNWQALAKLNHTLVFYMGIKNMNLIVDSLKANGMSGETPAAIVMLASTKDQKSITGDLSNIQERFLESGIKPPALLIVGHVIKLRDKLNWFEK